MNLTGSTLSFPIAPDVLRGALKTVSKREEIIVQAIEDIFETRQGERVMMPDYGVPDFVFSVKDSAFAARLAFYLEAQIANYVPLVRSVTAQSATDELHRAIIKLQYAEVGEINAPRNLVFPVWRYLDAD